MWQVLLAAAVAGSTSLVAKHLFSPNADPNPNPIPQQTDNQDDCNDSGNVSNCEKQDGIFRFSSSGSRKGAESRSRSKTLRKKAVGQRSGGVHEVVQPRRSARRFSVCLKRRKTSKSDGAKCGSSSSNDSSLFGWGLGVGIMYMMSAGKAEISKLNITVDETAKVVQELKTELYKRKSSHHTQQVPNKYSTENRDSNDIKVSALTVIDDGECASSVLTEEPDPRVLEIDKLEAELESELQKLPWCITEASHQEEMSTNLGETKASAMGFNEAEGQSDSYQSHGVLPVELDKKLSQLLIEQQENQIVELESELHSAQSKLNEKDAELQALKDCVRRLTDFSLSTVSDDEIEANEEQDQTSEWDYKNKTESEAKKTVVGMKRAIDSDSFCSNPVR